MGDIGLNFGQKAFEETLEPLFLSTPGFLSDKAAAVRELGVKRAK